jgi:hypothetical protein
MLRIVRILEIDLYVVQDILTRRSCQTAEFVAYGYIRYLQMIRRPYEYVLSGFGKLSAELPRKENTPIFPNDSIKEVI